MIKITLPDGSVREFEKSVTGLQIAEDISPRLAKEVLAISINDELSDLTRPIYEDANIILHKFEDDEGKHAFWHTSAHILAEAIEALFPGTKFGIGPAIENGFYYDIELAEGKTLSENDFPAINKKMLELCQQNNPVVRKEVSKAEAISTFEKKGDNYKTELISELEDGTISFYQQGNFTDLCRGPHLPSTGYIKAIQVLSLAGAYWRGDETRKQLTRVYAISFPKQKMLQEYLLMLEEAKKRDHRKIGKELELFHFSQKVGMGMALWLPKGTMLRDLLESWLTEELKKRNYEMVKTPHIGHIDLYKTSGHYEKYGKDSFQAIQTPAEGEAFMLKPMNCPHHVEIFKARQYSYRDLPYRMAEFGTVYRYEQHGELHGLTRVRSFTQDDAHVFCRPDQVKDEFKKIIELVMYVFKSLNFTEYKAQISLRDPKDKTKYIGSDENWDKAEQAIQEAAEEMGLKPKIELGEAAFYGPKLDFMVKDALGRTWQLGTIQVDYNLPERFELEYKGSDNEMHRPIMIHRAIFGSMERFVAVLIEHTAGKFPLWLSPQQIVLLPISEKFNNYSKKVLELLKKYDIRGEIDDRNEKIGRKIRDNELKRIPYLLIVGEKEVESNTVSVRKQGQGDLGIMSPENFAELINKEIQEYFNN
ncbi:MAG: threonine--tRNA ligase [Bacteroidales bacterium]|jgi:threonyl-tRNA synthetase|nr:threonine--tRNA ligase [Bacteroidales bacterium]MDY0313655.1 threonine--tRNA ligase [Bacteroidales bacterium]NLB85949.1 threonine--tRNA ligase [Bacteroidales bacterium]